MGWIEVMRNEMQTLQWCVELAYNQHVNQPTNHPVNHQLTDQPTNWTASQPTNRPTQVRPCALAHMLYLIHTSLNPPPHPPHCLFTDGGLSF